MNNRHIERHDPDQRRQCEPPARFCRRAAGPCAGRPLYQGSEADQSDSRPAPLLRLKQLRYGATGDHEIVCQEM